jgi:hypothetical protein
MTETERERLKKVVKEVWGSQRACAAELGIGEEHLSDILRGKYPHTGCAADTCGPQGAKYRRTLRHTASYWD